MSRKVLVWTGLSAALIIGIILSPYASSHPDGLERVAIDNGFIEQEKEPLWSTPVSGYEWSALADKSPAAATAISGLVGVLLTYGISVAVGKGLASRKRRSTKHSIR
ncbi:MAG: hypothetical protein K0R57_1016 [Paenibacillaceae bacterium]|jgi:cobalt/nickel transport protein|nr:hypothetical protein [Paenibacillaceae bacterium]